MSTAWLLTLFFGVYIAASLFVCIVIVRGGTSNVPFKRRRRS